MDSRRGRSTGRGPQRLRPPWEAGPVQVAAPPAPRRRTWLAFGLVIALLVWFGAVASAGLLTVGLPSTAASRFVPADGYRRMAVVGEDGRRLQAMVEDARLRGTQLRWAVSPSLFKALPPPPGVRGDAVAGVRWWREGITNPGGDPRYRVFSVTDDGVRLHGQDWGQRGLTLDPPPLWLPAGVHAGRTWTGHGVAAGAGLDGLLDYRMTATATPPPDGAEGCLQVTYTTELTRRNARPAPATRWTEQDRWCTGEGIVASNGSLGDAAYSVSTEDGRRPVPAPDNARARTPDTSGITGWRLGRLSAEEGDDTFGSETMQAFPEQAPVVTTLGCIVFGSAITTDLVGLIPLETGTYWLHWWVRPAGRILSVAAFGRTVVVTTSERRMMAYAPGGRLLWSVHLDDVALAPPVRVSGDRLAVASVRGVLSVRSAVDGHLVWSHRIPHGVARPLASDGSVVAAVDDQRGLHVLDAHTGRERWTTEVGLTGGQLAVSAGRTVVVSSAVDAYDNRTGRLVWHHTGAYAGGVAVDRTEVAVQNGAGVHLYALADGSGRGFVRGASDPQPVGGDWFVLSAGSLVAVNGAGATVRSWRLSVHATKRAIVVGPDSVWVFGYAPGDLTLTGERVRPR